MPETLIGGSALSDALTWANDLIAEIDSGAYKSLAASWIAGDAVASSQATAMLWASDANAYVCSVVMPNGAAALTAMSDLYPTYYDSVIPTIELQIAKGGYRLANWVRICLFFIFFYRPLTLCHGPECCVITVLTREIYIAQLDLQE